MNKDEIKNRILSENTAQGVLNHLRELESNRKHMQCRWIWELLQNARDASADDDTRLVADVEVRSNELFFRHNGRRFTENEVCHLIYHGSTKIEDEQAIGQYGSGFLATHLLSPEIDVAGQLVDGQPFRFSLRREVGSASSLSTAMDRAWDEFYTSRTGSEPTLDDSSTQFRYPIDDGAIKTVRDGITTLTNCASLVVTFNRKFRRINVSTLDTSTSFEVIERLPLQQGLQRVAVEVRGDDDHRREHFLLMDGELASIAIPLEVNDTYIACGAFSDTPKLFLGFPLIGTEHFSSPVVINSLKFTPTPERDGVYLAQASDDANAINQAVVEEAWRLLVKLIRFASESSYARIHTLAYIPQLNKRRWLDEDWTREQLRDLVTCIRRTPAVLCAQGPTTPRDTVLPLAESHRGVEIFWELLNQVDGLGMKLPTQREAGGWYRSIRSWAAITECEAKSFTEGFDGDKLVRFVVKNSRGPDRARGTLDALQELLVEDTCAVTWLDTLCQVLREHGYEGLIREAPLILSDAGYLDTLANLYRDAGVDENLKDIADDILGLKIREGLRDRRLSSLTDESGKGNCTDDTVLTKIIKSLNERCAGDNRSHDLVKASSKTLAWIVGKQEWTHLEGFPMLSTQSEDGERQVLRMAQLSRDDSDIPLAPVRAWSGQLQEFAGLFPWSYTVAAPFFEAIPDHECWRTLSERGYVRTEVLFQTDAHLDRFLPDEPLTDDDHHRTVDPVTSSNIVFLTKEKVGIMARVRSSQTRARLFWRFLTEWLVDQDEKGLAVREAHCMCGSDHSYFGSRWLVPLVDNRWVPQGGGIRDRATARSLGSLLRGYWKAPSDPTTEPSVLRLLDAMKVTRLDLIREFLVGDDKSRLGLDDAMANILVSTDGDLDAVSEFVEDLKSDRHLESYLAERRNRRRIVHENQRLGKLVEEIVKASVEGEGFTVRRTGIGSDFEMEYDVVEGSDEIGIELSHNSRTWLVEVKGTRDQRVRMTPTQARMSVEKADKFLLCVVPVGRDNNGLDEDRIYSDMRFVQGIGSRVEAFCENWDTLNEIRDDVVAASVTGIQLEIQAGTARIRVEKSVWQDGMCLKDLSTQLVGEGHV